MWDDKQNIKTTNKGRDKVESLQSDGSKTWTKKIKKKKSSRGYKYFKKCQGMYEIRQYESEDTRKEVNISSVNGIIDECREKWLIHLSRIGNDGLPHFVTSQGTYSRVVRMEAIHRKKMAVKVVEGLSPVLGKQ